VAVVAVVDFHHVVVMEVQAVQVVLLQVILEMLD